VRRGQEVDLHADDFGAVLLMLSESGVLFLSEHIDLGRRWVMPMRLPEHTPPTLAASWEALPHGPLPHGRPLRLSYALHIAPPGLVERLMAACYGLGFYHRFWRRTFSPIPTMRSVVPHQCADDTGPSTDVCVCVSVVLQAAPSSEHVHTMTVRC
jgi:hypothetical protein